MKYNVEGLNQLSKEFNQFQIDAGFTDSNISKRLMLVITEISEAFEAYRKDKYANLKAFETDTNVIDGSEPYKKHFEENIKDSIEDEMADSVISLLAFCGENNINIERHIELKMKYNEMRGFKFGGKKF